MPDLPQEFGPYTLQELIARGGMAEIYRASMPGIGGFEKTVAIKKILPHLAEDDEFIDMLVDEARIIEKLDHANIAQVFDLGEIDASYYIAMEYIHGVDLSAVIDELANHDALLPYEHTAYILANVCDGLHFAHNKTDENGNPLNVIHRDISPHNVMLSFAGDVKIIDFGVAKAADQQGKTESGTIKGKLLYMAPEQAKSDEDLDGRADLFAVGLCGYKMLTDALPFRGENEFEVYDNVLNAEIPPPVELQPDVPQRLNDIVMKLLRRNPAERYQSGYDAQQDFERVVHDIAPGYTVNRLSNFVEENFSHLLHEQTAGDTSAPEEIPEGTPSPKKRQTGQRNLDDFPSKADTSGASAQQKAKNLRAGQPGTDPHREAVGESVPEEDIHGEATRAVAPEQLGEPGSNPVAPAPDASGSSPQQHEASTGQLDEAELTAEQSNDSGGLTTNQLLLIGIGLVSCGIIASGAFLYLSPNRSLFSPGSTADASEATDSTESVAAEPEVPNKQSGDQAKQQANARSSDDGKKDTSTVVSIDTVPPGATVIRDGSELGKTPHELSLTDPDGPIDIALEKEGFARRTVQFLPVDGAQKTFDLSAKDDSDAGESSASAAANSDDTESTAGKSSPPAESSDKDDDPTESESTSDDTTAASEKDDGDNGEPKESSSTDSDSASDSESPSNQNDDNDIIDPFAK